MISTDVPMVSTLPESQTPSPLPPAATPTGTTTPLSTFTPTDTLPIHPVVSGFPYAAELNDALPKENLVLAWHFYSDMIGHVNDEICYDIGLYNDDSYIAISCLPEFTYPAPNGRLTDYQSKYIHHWVEKFQSFDEQSIHGLLKFAGRGGSVPEYADKVSMQALLEDIEWDANQYIHRGGYPPVVFHARAVLMDQLGMWLDNSAILKFEVVDFPDSCLGAPEPDEICEQSITRGFRIFLGAQGMMYEFHTDTFGYEIRTFGEPQIAPTKGPGG